MESSPAGPRRALRQRTAGREMRLVLLLCLLLVLPLPPAAAKRRAKGSSAKERRQERKTAEIVKLTQEELWAQEDEAMPAYNSALDAEDAGDIIAAEQAYRDAIAVAPAWVAPAMNRAVLLNSMRRTKEAIAQYKALLSVHKNHAQAMFNLANAHRSIDQLEEAKVRVRVCVRVCVCVCAALPPPPPIPSYQTERFSWRTGSLSSRDRSILD